MNLPKIKYKKLIDQQLVAKLTDYLQTNYKYLSKLGLVKIMAGTDGGINSVTASVLLKQAVGENMTVMIFDFGAADTNNLIALCNKFSLNSYILNRQAAYQAEISAYHNSKQADVSRFYQRFVNYHLFIQADGMKAGVIDVLDKSNRLLGTRPEGFYGHLTPFYSLYKSEIYDLAKFLQIPAEFLNSPFYHQGLQYPDNTALTWDMIDPILFLLTEKQLSPEQISKEHNIDLSWLKKLRSLIDKASLKTAPSQFLI